jgi:hypothetical protein
MEQDDTRGLSQRELLLELRIDLKCFIEDERAELKRIDEDILNRPTRAEVMALFSVAGVLMGILVAAMRFIG